MRTLMIDTRQQAGKHRLKDAYFEKAGIPTVRTKLLVGDYQWVGGMVAVDTKRSVDELVGNLCQSNEHKRFKAEADLAYQTGIKLHVLVENGENLHRIEDLKRWSNPRYKAWYRQQMNQYGQFSSVTRRKAPVSNITLIKILCTFAKKHHVNFAFCSPVEAGKRIIELLGDPDDRQ